MGISNIYRICIALFFVSPLASFAALNETGIRYPSNIQRIVPTAEPFKFSDSRNWNIVSDQKGGRINVPTNINFKHLSPGRLLSTAVRASPVAFAATGLGVLTLQNLGYEYIPGQGFVPVDVEPADPDSWGVAPEGISYNARTENFQSMQEAAQYLIPFGIGCNSGQSCTLVGIQDYNNCLETLNNNCFVRPRVSRDGTLLSPGNFAQIIVVNPVGSINCPSNGTYVPERYGCIIPETGEPVPLEEVEQAILDADYSDIPSAEIAEGLNDLVDSGSLSSSDFNAVNSSLPSSSVDVVIDSPVNVSGDTSTVVDNVTGETIVTTTDIEYTFDPVYNPDTGTIDLVSTETVTETTYQNGVVTGTNTTTNAGSSNNVTRPADPANDTDSGGSFELPDFCSWATVVCDWFDWTKEPLEDEPDLSDIVSDLDDFERSKDISFGSKSCPADIPLNIEFINKTVMLSFNWFCELAGIIYFMVMASAYVYAAYISLGVVRG